MSVEMGTNRERLGALTLHLTIEKDVRERLLGRFR